MKITASTAVVGSICLFRQPSKSAAFSASLESPSRFGIARRSAARTRLLAIIYAPDDEDDSGGKTYDTWTSGLTSLTYEEPSVNDLSLVDSLAKQHTAALARLACAFVPPGHGFELKDVETVHVLDVDESHINVSVVLCEAQGCVTVSVPVSFPKPCVSELHTDTNSMTSCILDNIEILDGQAATMISEYEWTHDHHEEIAASADMRATLIDEHVETYPSWWVVPTCPSIAMSLMSTSAMPNECRSVRELLNEDEFQEELRALAGQHLNDFGVQEFSGDESHANDQYIVEQAGVASVGPAGFILRVLAKAVQVNNLSSNLDYDDDDDDDLVRVLEVPIAFGTEAKTIEDLRASVLGAVASVLRE